MSINDLSVTTKDGETFLAEEPTLDVLLKVTEFNELYLSKGKDNLLATNEGIRMFFEFVLDIFGNDELTMEKLRRVKLSEFKKTLSLGKINSWVSSFTDDESDSEGKKKQAQ